MMNIGRMEYKASVQWIFVIHGLAWLVCSPNTPANYSWATKDYIKQRIVVRSLMNPLAC